MHKRFVLLTLFIYAVFLGFPNVSLAQNQFLRGNFSVSYSSYTGKFVGVLIPFHSYFEDDDLVVLPLTYHLMIVSLSQQKCLFEKSFPIFTIPRVIGRNEDTIYFELIQVHEGSSDWRVKIIGINLKLHKLIWELDLGVRRNLSNTQVFHYIRNRIYYINNNDLFCIDTERGKILWKKPVGKGMLTGNNNALFFVSKENFVAFSPHTGIKLWNLALPQRVLPENIGEADFIVCQGNSIVVGLAPHPWLSPIYCIGIDILQKRIQWIYEIPKDWCRLMQYDVRPFMNATGTLFIGIYNASTTLSVEAVKDGVAIWKKEFSNHQGIMGGRKRAEVYVLPNLYLTGSHKFIVLDQVYGKKIAELNLDNDYNIFQVPIPFLTNSSFVLASVDRNKKQIDIVFYKFLF